MPTTASSPVHASVAFLRIPRFDARGVSEQAALKHELEANTRAALAALPLSERAVLDADDGLAVVLFGSPARALDAIEALRARDGGSLQVGMNYGPLALTSKGPDARVFGDGLSAAAAAARFATPEQLLVTEEFAKALEARDPGRAAALAPAGDFTDTRVRLHSLYAPDPARRIARRRRALRQAAAGVLAILALGIAARAAHRWIFTPEPALVSLAIKPRGEVFVDGVSHGRTPPLTRVEIPAGRHLLVVRSPGFAPFELTLDLKPGERRTVAHVFGPGRTEPKSNFWRDLRRRFGGS